MKTTIGTLHQPSALFLRVGVGSATDDETRIEYELNIGAGNSAPLIQNKKTGRWFALSWPDIINLAKDAGIDKPFAPEGANRVGHQARADLKRRRTP